MSRVPGLRWDCWPDETDRLLLQAALHVDDAVAASSWRLAVTRLDTDHLTDEQYRLLPLLAARVTTTAPDDPRAGMLAGVARRTAVQNLLHLRAVARPVGVLRDAGIEPVLLKGPALALTAYDHVGLRPFVDADLLVPTDRMGEARTALTDAGWTQAARDFPGNHAVPYQGDEIDVDLHRALSRELVVPGRPTAVPWWPSTRTAGRPLPDGTPVTTLTPAGHLVHAVVHGTQLVGPVTSRWVADVTALVRRGGIDWDLVVDLADRCALGPVLAQGLRFAGRTSGSPAPTQVLRALERQRCGAFERLRTASFRTRPRTDGRLGGLPRTLAVHLQRTRDRGPVDVARRLPTFLVEAWGAERPRDLPVVVVRRALPR